MIQKNLYVTYKTEDGESSINVVDFGERTSSIDVNSRSFSCCCRVPFMLDIKDSGGRYTIKQDVLEGIKEELDCYFEDIMIQYYESQEKTEELNEQDIWIGEGEVIEPGDFDFCGMSDYEVGSHLCRKMLDLLDDLSANDLVRVNHE